MNPIKFYIAVLAVIVFIVSFPVFGWAQISAKTDSVIRSILAEKSLTEMKDKGSELILNGNLSAAGMYYNDAIKKDDGNKDAYFNRGVVSWVMNDTLNACRDWSAVLALGDTATFKLLDSKCHGMMTIEDEVLPKEKYRQLFTQDTNIKSLSSGTHANIYADEMPQFPGGETALLDYLSKSVKLPAKAVANGLHGRVYINFIVSSKGKILFPYVVRGIGGGCDEEALRVIKQMPLWKPGKEKGKPVLVRYNLPVKF